MAYFSCLYIYWLTFAEPIKPVGNDINQNNKMKQFLRVFLVVGGNLWKCSGGTDKSN